ncbi:MAG: hypothetical protein U0Z44_01855 [Kouleothrix sp.]
MAQARIPQRGEIAPEYTWDTTSVFAGDTEWEAALARVAAALPRLARFQGQLKSGPAMLAEWLHTSEQLVNAALRVYMYANMLHDTDTANQDAAAKYDRASSLLNRVYAACAFAEPELLAIGGEQLRAWLAEDERLAGYTHYIDQLEQRQAHVRSAEVEELLGQVLDPFGSAKAIHGILCDADLRFQPAQSANGTLELAQGTISALLTSPEREVRRSAWQSYADAHLALKHKMAGRLATGVKQQVFLRAPGAIPALEAALARNVIPLDVFHNLIETFAATCRPGHRYFWRAPASARLRHTARLRCQGAAHRHHALSSWRMPRRSIDLREHAAAGRRVCACCGAARSSSAGSISTQTRASAWVPTPTAYPARTRSS